MKRIEGEFYLDDSAPDKTTKVWIDLTDSEYDEMKRAHNQWRLWLMFWKCPADFMSAELEDLLCGYRPDRYSPRE